MKQVLTAVLVFVTLTAHAQISADFFDKTDAFLKQHVRNGKVNYAAVKRSPGDLNALVGSIKTAKLGGVSADEKKAFYINAYNLLVIKSVITHYPIARPLDVDGFFDKTMHTVAGEALTLNDIENKKLRAPYNDARIHFVLVCAAVSCPQLEPFAYRPEKLNFQLNLQTRKAMNDADFIRYDKSSGKVEISEIFKWYKQDFPSDVLKFINKYRRNKIPSGTAVVYYTYNWKLNDR